ncbi:hypothetical protein [Micromonospora sp. LH3U1]|uniref:hypothetical protein n=1 Tax=Micromonospora sp. LH3U1 TaxID=3018339 RepID=UPI00234B0F0F|nr:hypothetical protein [Micromonospora sp. LH3U1]WCN84174.1 hypothetical protein PCA76_14540 [Micromonospora sp. LH3U1]
MPAVVALLLTLALAPTPSPSATSGPVGDLLGGIGQVVDDLLGVGGTRSAAPTPTVTPTPASTPSATGQPGPVAPIATPGPAGSSTGVQAPAAPDRPAGGGGTGAREAAVPRRNGDAPAPVAPPTLGDPGRDGWPPAYYLLVAGALGVLALLLLRRRPAGLAAAPTPAPAPTPEPDPGPAPDNVSRLPTNLNAIYELGRLDERLDRERGRRT